MTPPPAKPASASDAAEPPMPGGKLPGFLQYRLLAHLVKAGANGTRELRTGPAIWKKQRSCGDEWTYQGSVFNALRFFVERSWVSIDGEHAGAQVYCITPEGRGYFARWERRMLFEGRLLMNAIQEAQDGREGTASITEIKPPLPDGGR